MAYATTELQMGKGKVVTKREREWQGSGQSAAETQQAYYGRPATKFGPYQRSLCNKCHAKD